MKKTKQTNKQTNKQQHQLKTLDLDIIIRVKRQQQQ